MKLPKAWFLNGFLLLSASAFALGLAEVAVRMFFHQPVAVLRQDRYGLTLHWPGVTRDFLPDYGHEVSFNLAGMRDREHDLHKPAGVFRILVLGDSFVEAVQVTFEASLPGLVERRLVEQIGKQIEVVSAGVSGWGQDDELRYLTHYGLDYQPDLVLVAMTLHNDISDNLRQQWHTLREGVLVEQPQEPIPLLEFEELQIKSFLASRFQVVHLWRKFRHGEEMHRAKKQLDAHVMEMFKVPTPDEITRGVELTERLLARLKQVATSSGAQVVLVLLPIEYQLSDEIFDAFASSNDPESMQIDKPQETMRAAAVRLGIPVIDLLPGFRKWTADNSAPLFIERDGHWNEAGHWLASDVVVSELAKLGAVR